MKRKIIIFGGTCEGRSLAEFCEQWKIPCYVSVATEYGESLIEDGAYVKVLCGRMDEAQMEQFIRNHGIELLVDMTHPYAQLVRRTIKRASEQTGATRIRYVRNKGMIEDTAVSSDRKDCEEKHSLKLIHMTNANAAAEYLCRIRENILLTVGSKELEVFSSKLDTERLFVRVLPSIQSLELCKRAGIPSGNIIAAQGPFTVEMNLALLQQYHCNCLVTKDGGDAGGFREKQEACRLSGAELVVIERPKEDEGYSYEDIMQILKTRKDGLTGMEKPRVSIVGIGMGTAESMTDGARQAIENADILAGAGRMMDAFEDSGKKIFRGYQVTEIRDFIEKEIKEKPDSRAAVLVSGDIGFYSGAKRLLEAFSEYKVDTYPGISTPVFLAARFGMSWQDMVLRSAHGMGAKELLRIFADIRCHEKVFVLSGKGQELETLGKMLKQYGFGHVTVYTGERLSYPEERLWHGTAEELSEMKLDPLSAAIFVNPKHEAEPLGPQLTDDMFIREKVPMTKEEIRWISVARLCLQKDSVVYDIGAGTGSVSVELARMASKGEVYGIEKKKEAAELVRKNRERFALPNIHVIEGIAPEAMEQLPEPTHALIGGSSGNLREILECLYQKNSKVRVVINAISLETIAELTALTKDYCMEITSITAAKARMAGSYHLMEGRNPVYIAVVTGRGEAPC